MKPNDYVCQVRDPDIFLPCEEKISGLRCEKLQAHSDEHWLGDHTIRHSMARNEITCEEVEEILAAENASSVTYVATKKKADRKPLSKRKLQGLLAFAIIFPILLACALQFGFNGTTDLKNAFVGDSGAIQARNNKLVGYEGVPIKGTNSVQKALAIGKEITTPPALIFYNGKEVKGRKRLDVYMTFSDQDSRDFLGINLTTLKALVESGRVELYLHTLPTEDPFSIYAAEALAESFYYSPKNSWQFLVAVLKFSAENYNKDYSVDELAKKLGAIAKDNGIDEIDQDSIQNGTFASWLYSLTSDDRLAVATSMPSVFLADRKIPLPNLDLSSNDDFTKALAEK